MFTKTLALLLFPALAAAQYGPPPASPASASSSSTSSSPAVAPTAPANAPGQINVNVAFQGKFVFSPSNISAPAGTIVNFYFPSSPKHSVTQSSFGDPCTYLAANTSTNAPAGFDSGLTSASIFTINVTDTNPIWYYCKQISHCGLGMVGSINAPPTGDTFDQFMAAALAIGTNEPVTPDNGPVISGVDATATGPPAPDLTGASPSSKSGAMRATTSIGLVLFATVLGVVMA